MEKSAMDRMLQTAFSGKELQILMGHETFITRRAAAQTAEEFERLCRFGFELLDGKDSPSRPKKSRSSAATARQTGRLHAS